MSELKTNLEQILQEKTTKLIPENIKRKVEIFDVTGTDGDAEVEELQAKIIETRQEIADTRRDLENSAATVTETGENVTLNQTAEATLKKLGVGGNSEQESTTGKNLANDNDMLLGYWAYADGTYIRTNTWICTPKIACKGNVDYTFQFANNSRWYGFVWYDENNNFISTTNQQNNLQTGFRSFTAKSPSNAGYLVINIAGYPGTNDIIRTDDLINFQLEEGSTVTDYEPYTNGASPNPDYPQEITNVTGDVEVVVENKNLFDKNNANTLNTAIGADSLGANVPGVYLSVYIKCKANTTYTVSRIFDTTKNRFAVAYTEDVPNYNMPVKGVISNPNVSQLTITTGASARYLVAYVWLSGGTFNQNDIINSIQIEQNTVATNYVEHKSQTFTFPLGNEKLMLGDYLADDGIHHVRGQVVFDGTENWSVTVRDNISNFWIYNENVQNAKLKAHSKKCNNFVYSSLTYSSAPINSLCENSTKPMFIFKTNVSNTVEEWSTWLSTHNTTVEYELENEVIVPYTEAQQQVYDAMKKVISYEGQTNVIGSSGGSNPIFTVIAFKDADLAIASLDNRVTLLED